MHVHSIRAPGRLPVTTPAPKRTHGAAPAVPLLALTARLRPSALTTPTPTLQQHDMSSVLKLTASGAAPPASSPRAVTVILFFVPV